MLVVAIDECCLSVRVRRLFLVVRLMTVARSWLCVGCCLFRVCNCYLSVSMLLVCVCYVLLVVW